MVIDILRQFKSVNMTNRSDEEELHPLVSSLLSGGALPTADVKRYSRAEMMNLRTKELSMTRPDNLSKDFNAPNGKFSPLKWIQHRWEVEGIQNRPSSKKIDSLCAGADENTGLSPQRRAFSSGCRAPADSDETKDGDERLGGHGKNWRNGSSGGSEKVESKGNDFKLPFQKGGFERGNRNEWRRNEKESRSGFSKFLQNKREDRGSSVGGNEKLPEWADGPTTMDDMIELRGFDEPKKTRKRNPKDRENKKDAKSKAEDSAGNGSRPSSAGLINNKGNVEQIEDTAIETAEIAFPSVNSLPETDHELAALLGILDVQSSTTEKKDNDDSSEPVSRSRLSRFFGNNIKTKSENESQNDDNSSNPVLAKIFGQAPSGEQTPANGSETIGFSNIKGGMRLEDIEKSIGNDGKFGESKGSPLQDPSQHAELLNQLDMISKQQGHINGQKQSSPPLNINGVQLPHAPMPPPNAVPLMADPQLLASFAQNPILLNAHVESQLQKAIAAATRANNGQEIPGQLMHELKMAAARNRLFLQQQTLLFWQLAQAQQNMQNQPKSRTGNLPSLIPASVQKQLNRASASTSADKKEKINIKHDGQQPQNSVEDRFARPQMQKSYPQMSNIVNYGLGMSAFRGSQNNPSSQQMQMYVAQQQQQLAQAHQMRMLIGKQQQQIMMARLIQMKQQQQQQAQMQHSHQPGQGINLAPGAERSSASADGFVHQSQENLPSSMKMQNNMMGPNQTPLEKLLASVGVQASQFTGNTGNENRLPASARPMSLEELEKELVAQPK